MTTMSLRERMSCSNIGNGQLRVSVIGAYTANAETRKPYTVYRTLVCFQGECYERQLRYSAFRTLYKNLKLKHPKASIQATFPPRVWSHRATMDDAVVESRQVLLDEYMREVCRNEWTAESEEMLMKMLRVGAFEDVHGRFSTVSLLHRSAVGKKDPFTVEVIHEEREEDTNTIDTLSDHSRKPLAMGTATIVHTSCVYHSIHSNAETVLTEDERSSTEVHANEAMLMEQEDGVDVRVNSLTAEPVSTPPPLQTPPSTPTPTEQSSLKETMESAHLAMGQQEEEEKEEKEDLVSLKSLPPSYRDRVDVQLSKIQKLLTESKQAEEQVSKRLGALQPSTALTA